VKNGGTWHAGAGHGLAGMRERAAVAGGTVTAGPGAGGGFRVTAELPLSNQDEPGAAPLAAEEGAAP
jgi:glucose-6-phosphate-specific signal transduction histidine kinase